MLALKATPRANPLCGNALCAGRLMLGFALAGLGIASIASSFARNLVLFNASFAVINMRFRRIFCGD